ncbi:MAG: HRDC domain-containing protein [Planctomycetaceae bacterium]|nr:HRDC domain-containing protein [Planctomycetaceae bacterium]
MPQTLITSQAEFNKLLRQLEKQSVICFDTEFISEGRFRPLLCLLQIAAGKTRALVDPLALSLKPFWELVCSGKHEVVVHACRCEMEFCLRDTGTFPPVFFDIQLAAGFAGLDYPTNLASIIKHYLHIDIPKAESRTVWNKRPLTQRQIDYAFDDVLYLEQCAAVLKKTLTETGRLNWYYEEVEERNKRLKEYLETPQWRGLPKSGQLNQRELAIARELWFWRNTAAEKYNLPLNRVLRDDLIIELAHRKTCDPQRISAVRGLPRNDSAQTVKDIAEAIKRGLDLQDSELPPLNKTKSYPQYHNLTHLLFSIAGSICRNSGISMQLIGSPNDIREWLAGELGTLPEGIIPRFQSGWRAELFANQLRDLLYGKTAIRLDRKNTEDPLVILPLDGSQNRR